MTPALCKASSFRCGRDAMAKALWSSPAGKKRLAPRIVDLLASHKIYVEPFAGSAAVLFAKQSAETEVVNDIDPDIARAFRAVQGLSEGDMTALRSRSWTGNRETFMRLLDERPASETAWLHRSARGDRV